MEPQLHLPHISLKKWIVAIIIVVAGFLLYEALVYNAPPASHSPVTQTQRDPFQDMTPAQQEQVIQSMAATSSTNKISNSDWQAFLKLEAAPTSSKTKTNTTKK